MNIKDKIKRIKFLRMPIEYKELAEKLKNTYPVKINNRITYYKINDIIIFEYYNSGTVEKPYNKIFYNDEIWTEIKYKYDYDVVGITRFLKKITLDIKGIKASSLGRKTQDGDYLFYT